MDVLLDCLSSARKDRNGSVSFVPTCTTVSETGFEPATSCSQSRRATTALLGGICTLYGAVLRAGFEPATRWFSASRSTGLSYLSKSGRCAAGFEPSSRGFTVPCATSYTTHTEPLVGFEPTSPGWKPGILDRWTTEALLKSADLEWNQGPRPYQGRALPLSYRPSKVDTGGNRTRIFRMPTGRSPVEL